MDDLRDDVGKFYDATTTHTFDIPFYEGHITKNDPSILELGCGTGRVTIPLSNKCEFITGVDISEFMLSICREKIKQNEISSNRIQIKLSDITKLELNRKFGLIIAPYRVFQNLSTDKEVDNFFSVVKKHLSPNGSCILNVFNPKMSIQEFKNQWRDPNEHFEGETPYKSGVLKRYVIKDKITIEPLVIYPKLIDRYFVDDKVKEEASFRVPMRVYYPDEFIKTIESHGFKIIEKWGGYENQPYGEGSELVVKFALSS